VKQHIHNIHHIYTNDKKVKVEEKNEIIKTPNYLTKGKNIKSGPSFLQLHGVSELKL